MSMLQLIPSILLERLLRKGLVQHYKSNLHFCSKLRCPMEQFLAIPASLTHGYRRD